MGKFEEVSAALDGLQADIDAKQAEIAAFIQFLKDQIAAGPPGLTPEQADAVVARATDLATDIRSTPAA